jgi:hypothetical protein
MVMGLGMAPGAPVDPLNTSDTEVPRSKRMDNKRTPHGSDAVESRMREPTGTRDQQQSAVELLDTGVYGADTQLYALAERAGDDPMSEDLSDVLDIDQTHSPSNISGLELQYETSDVASSMNGDEEGMDMRICLHISFHGAELAHAGLEGSDLQERIEALRKSSTKLGKPRAKRRAPIGGKWTKDEDEHLRRIVEGHGAKNWKKVTLA